MVDTPLCTITLPLISMKSAGRGLGVINKAPTYRCSPVDRVHLAGEVVNAQTRCHTPSQRSAAVFTGRARVTRNV